MSRRRPNPERKVGPYMREHVKPTVANSLDNRHRLLAPFPVEVEQIYPLLFNSQQLAAIQVLRELPGILRVNNAITIIDCINPINNHSCYIRVTLPRSLPGMIEMKIPLVELPTAMGVAINEWIGEWLRLNAQKNCIQTAIEEVSQECRTWGQVYRIWPGLLSFFGPYGRSEVANARAKAPYPFGVTQKGEDGKRYVTKDFSPERFVEYDMALAESLMMPRAPFSQHIGTVSY